MGSPVGLRFPRHQKIKVWKTWVGQFALVFANRRITKEIFDRSFPQGIFGKIIKYDAQKGLFIMRCYRPKRKGSNPNLLNF